MSLEVPEPLLAIGGIDSPEDGSAVDAGTLTIRGWALGLARPLSRVELWLDDHLLGRARMGRPRPDIAAARNEPTAALAGFTLRVDLGRIGRPGAPVPPGRQATLRARAVLLGGQSVDVAAVTIALPESDRSEPPGRPVRLLCFAQGLDRGGSQLRMRELVAHLARSGDFAITIVTPREGPLRADLEESGAEVSVAAVPYDDIAAYEAELTRLAGWAEGRFDVVLGYTLSSFPAIDLAERLGLPALWRIGDREPVATVVSWLGSALDPEVARCADRAFGAASTVFFNSEEALRFFRESGHLGRFVVLGSGTDVDAAAQALAAADKTTCRRRLGIAPEKRVLLNAATLWPIKGQTLLLTALAELRPDHPELECVLVGQQNPDYVDGLSRLIERLGLHDAARILPFTEDLDTLRVAADVAVSASEHESMSGSILEAMAFGLPVLSTRVGGAAEVVEDGVTGWLCDANDVGALADGLRRVAEADPREIEALGVRAMRRVRLEHDSRVAQARIADLIRQTARERRGAHGEAGARGVEASEIETVALVASHLLIAGRLAEDTSAATLEIAGSAVPITARIDAAAGLDDDGFIAIAALGFEAAKLLAETTAPLTVTLRLRSGETCARTLPVTTVFDARLAPRRAGIAALAELIEADIPDMARILRSLAAGEHWTPTVSCDLGRHVVAPHCGLAATGWASGIGAQPVVFLLDDMKLAVNPDHVFQNLPGAKAADRRGGHSFTLIETIEGARHDLRLCVLDAGGVAWSAALALTNTGSPRALVEEVAALLSRREMLHLLARGDLLHQLALHYTQPAAATVSVTELAPARNRPDISVIVPFYRDDFFLIDHLESQRRTDAAAEWLFVCDDPALLPSMLDTGRARREEISKPTRLLGLSDNVGFAAANNIGVRHALGDYLVFMNSDVYWRSFEPIEYAVRLLREDSRVGVVGFTLRYEDGSLQHAGMRLRQAPELDGMLVTEHEGKGLPFARRVGAPTHYEAEAVTGALMVVRRRDFTDQVFCEDYVVADYEDGDLCMEMRARGKQVVVVDCDGLYHLERQSAETSATSRFLSFVNLARFTEKWAHLAGAPR